MVEPQSDIITREQAARDLPGLQTRIEETSRSWNREDGIIGLLCLQDAYDDLVNTLLARMVSSADGPRLPDELKVALFRHISQRFAIVDDALDLICHLGRSGPRTMLGVPPIEMSVEFGEGGVHHLYSSLVSHGSLTPADAAFAGTARLMAKHELGWIIRVEGCKGTPQEGIIGRLLDLTDLVTRHRAYVGAIRVGASLSVTQGNETPLVNYPASLTPRKIMEEEGIGPRRLFRSGTSAAEWTSDFSIALESSLPTIGRGIDSHSSRVAMKREHEQLFKGFGAFGGFSELFQSEFGCSLSGFEKVTDALQQMARAPIHHVYIGRYKKIVRHAAKISGVPLNEVDRIVGLLTWRKGLPTHHFPITQLTATHAFSMFGVRRALVARLEGCFQILDNNAKGVEFERYCRRIIRGRGFAVHPDRFKVPDQVLSDDDSYRIWGKIKRGTDFDVLGSRGIYLLFLECKERKSNTARMTRLKHMISRYSDELILKSTWLANNIGCLSGSPCITPQTPAMFVMPLLIYNKAFDEFHSPKNFMTSKELDTFAETFDFSSRPNEDFSLKVDLTQGVTLTVTCIPIPRGSPPYRPNLTNN